jgi:flagellar hook assembly protein FlgD
LFETTKRAIEVSWSYNPFSPDGNGIADTTWLILNLQEKLLETNPQIIVEIFDLTGKLISTLIDHEPVKSSSIRVQWDGKDKTGRIVDIGPYIYQIKLGSQVKNGVIVVAK